MVYIYNAYSLHSFFLSYQYITLQQNTFICRRHTSLFN